MASSQPSTAASRASRSTTVPTTDTVMPSTSAVSSPRVRHVDAAEGIGDS